MNERNVRALVAILGGAFVELLDGGALAPDEVLVLARRVIDAGVLVPSILTDAEVLQLFSLPDAQTEALEAFSSGGPPHRMIAWVRSQLERVARG